MYGQMTAGSWIYIGTQGILQGTYETFAELARQHFGGTLRGRVVLTAGLGGMGGAQPLAVTMNEGVATRHRGRPGAGRRRLEIGYVDRLTESPDEALALARAAAAAGEAISIALVGNAAEIEPAWVTAGERFDVVTDQTSAHDSLVGYVPAEISLDDAAALRDAPARRVRPPLDAPRWPPTSGRCSPSRRPARSSSTTATTCGPRRRRPGSRTPSTTPGSCPRSSGRSSARVAGLPLGRALRRPGRHPPHRRGDPRAVPGRRGAGRWIPMAQERVPFQGLPARICWLGYGERAKAGPAFNELVRTGEVSAPIVIGRDHLDAGSVASPNRETEAMRDGSDAIADWPLLNALVNTAAGATWVSIHHGGGVGHRLLPARRDGRRRGRHGARGAEARAGADDGPGDGRPAPCRRRLRACHRGRRASAVSVCRCSTAADGQAGTERAPPAGGGGESLRVAHAGHEQQPAHENRPEETGDDQRRVGPESRPTTGPVSA